MRKIFCLVLVLVTLDLFGAACFEYTGEWRGRCLLRKSWFDSPTTVNISLSVVQEECQWIELKGLPAYGQMKFYFGKKETQTAFEEDSWTVFTQEARWKPGQRNFWTEHSATLRDSQSDRVLMTLFASEDFYLSNDSLTVKGHISINDSVGNESSFEYNDCLLKQVGFLTHTS